VDSIVAANDRITTSNDRNTHPNVDVSQELKVLDNKISELISEDNTFSHFQYLNRTIVHDEASNAVMRNLPTTKQLN